MLTRRRWSKPKAFTLIEILIVVVILGILAAIVIPQFTKASEDAQVGNVQTQLQTIRSQIELYRVKNNGQTPDFLGALSGTFGDPSGATPAAQGLVGPDYMKSPPVNPRTNSASIAAAEAAGVGWVWADTNADGINELNAAFFDEVAANDGDPTTPPWRPIP